MSSPFKFSIQPQSVAPVSSKYRRIFTQLPCPGTETIINSLAKSESRSMHGQIPLVWDKASDFSIFDSVGNKWIDFTSTIFVANVGHSQSRVLAAIKSCVDSELISCYVYPNKLRSTTSVYFVSFVVVTTRKLSYFLQVPKQQRQR